MPRATRGPLSRRRPVKRRTTTPYIDVPAFLIGLAGLPHTTDRDALTLAILKTVRST
jgi:hypothetical protein